MSEAVGETRDAQGRTGNGSCYGACRSHHNPGTRSGPVMPAHHRAGQHRVAGWPACPSGWERELQLSETTSPPPLSPSPAEPSRLASQAAGSDSASEDQKAIGSYSGATVSNSR